MPVANQTKFQVPIDKKTYIKLKKLAYDMGFDSVQAYIRVWAAAATRGELAATTNRLELTKTELQALHYIELLLSYSQTKPNNVDHALTYVADRIKRTSGERSMMQLMSGTARGLHPKGKAVDL